jgi:hypothetical protein
MADGAVPIGPMEEESLRLSTERKVADLLKLVWIRWIALAVVMTAIVLDLAGVVQVPTDDLLGLLLYVL